MSTSAIWSRRASPPRHSDLEVEFQQRSVYEVQHIIGQFDYVFFMGVFYHLRYPLYALDQVVKKIRPEGRLIFQSMLRGSDEVKPWQQDYRVLGDQDVLRSGVSGDALRRAQLRKRPDKLVDPESRRSRGHAAEFGP